MAEKLWMVLTLAVVGAVVIGTGAVSGQQEPPAAAFFDTVDVELATVEVFVTDRRGNPVTGLTREDFELRIDGQTVPITNFYAEVGGRPTLVETYVDSESPVLEARPEPAATPARKRLKIVIFVDHTNIRAVNRNRVLSRLREFVDSTIRPEDAVAVVSLTGRLRIHSDLLNDPSTVARILDEIEDISFNDGGGDAERRRIFSELARGHTGGASSPFRVDPTSGGVSNAAIFSRATKHRIRAYATSEYHRTRASLDALRRFLGSMAGVHGRKALLYVSDGIVNRPGEALYLAWSNAFGASSTNPNVPHIDPNLDYTRFVGNFDLSREMERVAEAANAAGVTLYALDAESNHATGARSALLEAGAGTTEVLSTIEANVRGPLEFISEATGGRRIQASDQLAEDLASVAQDFDSYYSLGFRPPQGDPDAYHEIEVRLRGRQGERRIVRHRDGYRAKRPDEHVAEAMLAAVYFNDTENPLEFGVVRGEPKRREDGNVVLPLTLEIPVGRLTLVPAGGTEDALVSIFVTVKDKAGDARRVQRIPFHLQIPADKIDEAKKDVAHHTLGVILRPGDQQVAVGVRDEVASTLSTVRLEVAGTV